MANVENVAGQINGKEMRRKTVIGDAPEVAADSSSAGSVA
jgi:hypothetical protein